MRITSKGQVTIPQAVREKRGQVVLKPATKPSRAREEGMSPIRAAIRQARGSAHQPMFKGWSTDQIMAFSRGDD